MGLSSVNDLTVCELTVMKESYCHHGFIKVYKSNHSSFLGLMFDD